MWKRSVLNDKLLFLSSLSHLITFWHFYFLAHTVTVNCTLQFRIYVKHFNLTNKNHQVCRTNNNLVAYSHQKQRKSSSTALVQWHSQKMFYF